jgi:hypothetical protein
MLTAAFPLVGNQPILKVKQGYWGATEQKTGLSKF